MSKTRSIFVQGVVFSAVVMFAFNNVYSFVQNFLSDVEGAVLLLVSLLIIGLINWQFVERIAGKVF